MIHKKIPKQTSDFILLIATPPKKLKHHVHCYSLKSVWDSSIFSSIKPKLDIGLFVDLAEFPWIHQMDNQKKSLNLSENFWISRMFIHSNIKNTTTTKMLRSSTQISTINALSKWHDPRINNKKSIYFCCFLCQEQIASTCFFSRAACVVWVGH